jgi:serine/threonine-protein kinase
MKTHRLAVLVTLALLATLTGCSKKQAAKPGTTGTAANGGSAGGSGAGNGASAGKSGSDAANSSDAGAGNDTLGDAGGSNGHADAGGNVTGNGDAGAPTTAQQATQVQGTYFPAGAPWSTDVHDTMQYPKAADSDAITAWMMTHAGGDGWGGGSHAFQIDFSLIAVDVPAGTMKRTPQTGDPAFHADPDCDPAAVPLPVGGAVEGNSGVASSFRNTYAGYQCSGFDAGDDCHILLVARAEHRLYELYHATVDATGAFYAGCLALWDTSKVYDSHGRGDQCTSADAAGFPIAPLLFTAEEVKAGAIHHAIRFAIPNHMIRQKKYVPPATHGTNTTGPISSMPYGAHLRLKTPYPGMAKLSPAAQIVAKALQTYGMYMSDGGEIPLMGQADTLGTVKWSDVGLDSGSLKGIKANDFEVLAYPTPTDVTFDCKRTPITQ